MATLQELKTALRTAHNAGDTKAAQRIANMIATEQAMAIADSAAPAAPAPAQPQRQFIGQSIPQAITAPIELAATALTGGTTGMLGFGAGALAGVLESIRNGTFGTSVGAMAAERRAMEGSQRYTYAPRTELAKRALQAFGEAAEAAKLAPVPVTAVPQALAQGAVQQARAAVPAVAAQTAQAAGRAADIVRRPEAAAATSGVDESAAMRMPSIQYRIEPEVTPPLVEGTVADQISRTVAAGDTVDGRVVREEIPNTGSISASLENYEVLPGVREVPISAFDPEYVNKITMDRLDDRTRRLAQEIQQSREINPLIVVQDSEGMYVLEGGHRFDALVASGAKSLPAMVVIDLDDPPAQAAK
jgi:disulfide oxidoreductase YuzD